MIRSLTMKNVLKLVCMLTRYQKILSAKKIKLNKKNFKNVKFVLDEQIISRIKFIQPEQHWKTYLASKMTQQTFV